jgi:hypothetical protein
VDVDIGVVIVTTVDGIDVVVVAKNQNFKVNEIIRRVKHTITIWISFIITFRTIYHSIT